MFSDGFVAGASGTRLSIALRGLPKSMSDIPPVFDEVASLADVNIPLKARRLSLSSSTMEQLSRLPRINMPSFLKRKPSLTVDTKAANGKREPSSHDDNVFAAIFNANCLDYDDQSAKPSHNCASIHRSLSTRLTSQEAIVNTRAAVGEYTPSSHDDDVFAAIFDANSHSYGYQIVEPSPDRATICRSLSTSVVSQRAESTLSPIFSLAEDWSPASPPQSLLEFSAGEDQDQEELLQAKYEKVRSFGGSKGWFEAEVDDVYNYILEHGFPDLRSDFGFAFDPEDDDSAYAEPKIPKLTDNSFLVKKIESLYLRSTYGQDICSTRQIEETTSPPITEDRQQASLRTARNSIYLHSNSDISSNRATQPVASAFSSFSSKPSLDPLSISALSSDSEDSLESPAVKFAGIIPTDPHSPMEESPEVKHWGGQDSEPTNLVVTNLAAPQPSSSAEVLSEQSSPDDVYDTLPNLPHEPWPSLSTTTTSRDIVRDRNACFEHDAIPLLSPFVCNKSAPGACKIVHSRPATMCGACVHRTVPENNRNTSSFAGNTSIMTPPNASSEDKGLLLAKESSSLAKSMGKTSISEIQGSSSDERNTSIDASASNITEIKPSMRRAKECSIVTNTRGNLSKSSSLTGDDLAPLNTRPTITNNLNPEFSTHLNSSLPHTLNRTSSLVNNTTGSTIIEAQIQTANDINLTGEMGLGGNAYRKVKRVFSSENLSPKSSSIAGTVGRPTLMSTSNLGAVPDEPIEYDEPLSVPPRPLFARTFVENSSAPAFAVSPLSPARNVMYNSWASPYTTVPSSPTYNAIGNSWDSSSTTAPSSPRAKTNSSKQSSLNASAPNTLIGSRISPPTLHGTTIDSALRVLMDIHDDPDRHLPKDVRNAKKVRLYRIMN